MLIRLFVAAVLVAASPMVVRAADAPAQLRQFIATVQSATGEFSQQTLKGGATDRQAQTGTFSFQRPGRFKWHVLKPYEQLIVSDGKVLFQYDPDLAQVTQRSVDKSIGASPAAILFGSGSLDEAFTISGLPDNAGLEWLRAKPRSAEAGFTHVDIGFKSNQPVRLELLDSFGQTTRIELSGIVPNPSLAPDEFKFSPPAGVDIVQM